MWNSAEHNVLGCTLVHVKLFSGLVRNKLDLKPRLSKRSHNQDNLLYAEIYESIVLILG